MYILILLLCLLSVIYRSHLPTNNISEQTQITIPSQTNKIEIPSLHIRKYIFIALLSYLRLYLTIRIFQL